jgi:multicomponent K+:H+ antiporter subunit D
MFDFNNFWHAHTPILSILIPAFTSFLLLLLGNPGSGSLKQDWRQPWRRGISLGSALLGLITAISPATDVACISFELLGPACSTIGAPD